MKSQKVTDDEKLKMMKTLKRFEENSEDIGTSIPSLSDYLTSSLFFPRHLSHLHKNLMASVVADMMREDDSEESEDDEEDALSKLQNMNLGMGSMERAEHGRAVIIYIFADEADADTILSMLTPEQQEEFRDSVAKGKIGNWVDVWSPWWLHEEEEKVLV
jgi:hypothetical protein